MATVLIVDDELSYRSLLVLLMESKGHVVHEAVDGSEAVRILRDQPVDVVVTDVLMPNRDGIEVLSALRNVPGHPPVIVMSGLIASPACLYARIARRLGAVDAIGKTDAVRELPPAIERALASRPVDRRDVTGPSPRREEGTAEAARKSGPSDRVMAGLIGLIFLLLVGLTPSRPASAEQVVFAVGEWSPYVTESRADLGVHTALVRRAFARAGFDAVFEFMPWKRAFELTRTGAVVATFPWASTPERRREFLYSRFPLATEDTHFFYKTARFPEGLNIKTFEDVKAKKLTMVGVTSYWYEATVNRMGIDYHPVAGSALAWRYLDIERADVLLENRLVANDELEIALGAGRLSDFASTGPVHGVPYFILFSKFHDHAERLRDAWDAVAADN